MITSREPEKYFSEHLCKAQRFEQKKLCPLLNQIDPLPLCTYVVPLLKALCQHSRPIEKVCRRLGKYVVKVKVWYLSVSLIYDLSWTFIRVFGKIFESERQLEINPKRWIRFSNKFSRKPIITLLQYFLRWLLDRKIPKVHFVSVLWV